MQKVFPLLVLILILILSCQPPKEQVVTEEEAKILLSRFMETVTNTDTTLVEELLHPECEFRYPLLTEPLKGIDGYKAFIKNIPNIFSDFNAVIEEVNVKGDVIWCRYSMEGIHSGPLGDIPATNKRFEITGMAMTRLQDGKIIEDETFWNALSFYQQLGFMLSPPKAKVDS
jgi:steroid delta-isomerase-like uncharacterized protein